ncbi:hypothetical protein SAMN05443292_1146 [Halpernia frigidisoli]|uniref:Uncharacterized protein n=1 Tax=Halpernia frigidisoli TaxID=1125876 RepID=A0A1I3F4B8_9FLAO|nr:hypothetical protein SAMN05443292_1146 [Halpernia frigidisoli]
MQNFAARLDDEFLYFHLNHPTTSLGLSGNPFFAFKKKIDSTFYLFLFEPSKFVPRFENGRRKSCHKKYIKVLSTKSNAAKKKSNKKEKPKLLF